MEAPISTLFRSSDYNSISVKAGGGSVIYGSGAIGGTVHLNNDLVFLIVLRII